MVEGQGFIDFIGAVWTTAARVGQISRNEIVNVLPSAVSISRDIATKSTLLKNKLMTTDIWTDSYKQISYLCLIAHYFDESEKLCDNVIALEPMDVNEPKDSAHVRRVIGKKNSRIRFISVY